MSGAPGCNGSELCTIKADMTRVLPGSFRVEVEDIGTASLEKLSRCEIAAVERAVSRRRAEYAAGRIAAKQALAQLGVQNVSIPVANDRSPIWPTGFVGSISHAGNYAIACVAKRAERVGIGIDIEVAESLDPDLWQQVLTAQEIDSLNRLDLSRRCRVASAIYSLKEALFKFQYPITREWLDFHSAEAHLDFQSESAVFRIKKVEVSAKLEDLNLQARFSFIGAYVISAVYA